jgi:hypothetical protein
VRNDAVLVATIGSGTAIDALHHIGKRGGQILDGVGIDARNRVANRVEFRCQITRLADWRIIVVARCVRSGTCRAS